MPQWIWQTAQWPHLTWREEPLIRLLARARFAQGKLLGFVSSFTDDIQDQISAVALTDEMVMSSAIEGAMIDRNSVRSSIARRFGLQQVGLAGAKDRYVEGLLDMMLDATEHYQQPLTAERLCRWHAALFPTGYSGMQKIQVGQWRGEGPMQIVSGRGRRLTIHYEAPPYQRIVKEMASFCDWFNQSLVQGSEIDGILRAGVAHVWFEIVHPFDDGNGRIGRAIADMALAQDECMRMRFYSLSAQIMAQRQSYYDILGEVSRGTVDITNWLQWFVDCYLSAIDNALKTIDLIVSKSLFWQQNQAIPLNERQCKVLNKMLEYGEQGFVGGMTTRKYMHLTKTSRATAYRELTDLVKKSCLRPIADKGGRSSAYEVNWPAPR